ncbi:MAG TPA: hypothetical protein VN693_03660 [Rhodanobacteraceae bacterium]|nr:hypothetical protein [Rhodanobacteraceae bacterium]
MKIAFRILGVVLLTTALAACHSDASDDGSGGQAFELKLYKVPAAESRAIANSLSAVLESSDYRVGLKSHTEMTVTEPFPGAILVLAPKALQPSIGDAIGQLGRNSTNDADDSSGDESLQLHFWVVDAVRGQGEDSPELKPLAATLDRLRASLGASHFVLDSMAAATTKTNSGSGGIETPDAGKWSFVAQTGQGKAIDLSMQYHSKSVDAVRAIDLSTTVAAIPGQYIVLGQVPQAAPASQGTAETAPVMRLFVMRVDRSAAATH